MGKDEREILGKNGYEYAIKNYDYKILAKMFLKVLS